MTTYCIQKRCLLSLLAMMFSIAILVLQTPVVLAATADEHGFAGSQNCAECHAVEYDNWQGSHHDLAMQEATPNTVLGDFSDVEFTYNGVNTLFYRQGEKYMIRTDGEDGKIADFEVTYVFGVDPLQQYLLPLTRGRLQAFAIAWDTRSETEGGQRWFHLYPDEQVDHKDSLHWTGTYLNWNTRCAECHSTDLHKNYSADTRSFNTEYAELDVSCEACHGPGEQHIDLARTDALASTEHGGFPVGLAQRGEWAFNEGATIAQRTTLLSSNTQIDNCARCHSRRSTSDNYHYGAELLDTHRVATLQTPLYHPDGQIRDEVYVYGSFVQSKMHQAGVVCSNCHEPHSLELHAPANDVCAQCHLPSTYDTPDHHHHTVGSEGADCANCHMPETNYMVVDPRRDHSMRIPRPDLTQSIGTPNACNQCHTDQTAAWSLDSLDDWGIQFSDTTSHPAVAFTRFEQGDVSAAPTLASIAANTNTAPLWRASAMETLSKANNNEALQTAMQLISDENPLLRASAVRSLDSLPLPERFQLLAPLTKDNITDVRMAVADSLARVPLQQIPEAQADDLQRVFDEYLRIQQQHADMPSVQMQIGAFLTARGNPTAAEAAYREAITIAPQLMPAYINLADLQRTISRDPEARKTLLQALEIEPEHGPALHSLGLLEIRLQNRSAALDYLSRAAAIETTGTNHRFIYAIALHDYNQPEQAIVQLQKLLSAHPNNTDTLLALTNYHRELGQNQQALPYADELVRLAPDNQAYQQLQLRISNAVK